MNYEQLVKALRCENTGDDECGSSDCPYWSGLGCMDGQLMEDAAAAIEELQADNKEMLHELEDAAKQISELQDEVLSYASDSQPHWVSVEDELPKESNCYIVYLRQGTEMKTPEWMGGEPLSYVTEMGFDKEQMLWKDGDDAYNAVLSAVDTKKDFHVTHWMDKPEPPKEDAR